MTRCFIAGALKDCCLVFLVAMEMMVAIRNDFLARTDHFNHHPEMIRKIQHSARH